MQNAKDAARQLIDQLPDTATYNDIMYELYVKQKIERGLQDSREGKITSHEDVKKRYQQRADAR
jgi:predicted transcriptional regulator